MALVRYQLKSKQLRLLSTQSLRYKRLGLIHCKQTINQEAGSLKGLEVPIIKCINGKNTDLIGCFRSYHKYKKIFLVYLNTQFKKQYMLTAHNLKNRWVIHLIILLLFNFYSALSQESNIYLNDRKELLNHINEVYGSDDMLLNGRIYVPKHTLSEGHPYFGTPEWVLGNIYVKGSCFRDIKLKYDIELDEFILYMEDKYKRKNYLVLNHHYVDSLYLGKYCFVNTGVLPELNEDIGYAELVFHKDFIFLVKYNKEFIKDFSESKPYGHYSKQNSNRYISDSGELIKVSSKKAFLEYFEPEKREIKKYMKKQKINYKKANSGVLYNLLNYCNAIRKN